MPRIKADRKERVPLGHTRSKLSVANRKGYVRRWINDKGGRLENAEEGGYEFVSDQTIKAGEGAELGHNDLGSRVSKVVGTKEDGSPLRAYLMEIREDWYNEDQAEKQRRIDEIDAQIKRGEVSGNVGQDGRYIPNEGITYKTG